MNIWDGLKSIAPLWPTALALVVLIIVLYVARLVLDKRLAGSPDRHFRRQVMTLIITFIGILIIIIVMPISDTLRGHLLSLFGILLTAAIALSSTTFLGNIMAGFMLRAIRNFRPGDFVRVNEFFGRITERGLFHVEIQTEDRDLITLPNLYMVTNPVKVIRSDGTLISVEVSLGYDIPRTKIEKLMLEAAELAGLEEPFVHIRDLGDFSITYRVSGLLKEVKTFLSAHSRLRGTVMDKLHGGGIEIVSPTFMNTRALEPGQKIIPEPDSKRPDTKDDRQTSPEKVQFDKADQAESLEKLRERYDLLGQELESMKSKAKEAGNAEIREDLQAEIKRLEDLRQRLVEMINKREKDEDK